jgi:hypothetical protein
MRVITREEWGSTRAHIKPPDDSLFKVELGVHHTVSANTARTAAEERTHMRIIEDGHLARGFVMIGYSGSWAAAWAGNAETATPSVEARRTYRALIEALKVRSKFGQLQSIGGHREYPGQATACPGSNLMPFVAKWREDFDLLPLLPS